MKHAITTPVDINALQTALQQHFPHYKVKKQTSKILIVKKGFYVNAAIRFSKNSLRTNETMGNTPGEMLLTVVLILLGVLTFVLVYFIGFYSRAKKVQKELDTFLTSYLKTGQAPTTPVDTLLA